MPIVPVQSSQEPEASIVSLSAYARHIQACECAFFGLVNAPECTYSGGCRSIWTKDQRDWVQYYLAEAQFEIEEVIHYFVGRRWVIDEEHPYARRILTKWGYVVSGGVQATTAIAQNTLIDYSTEPATIGPLPVLVADVSQVHVYHHNSDIEIIPSSITTIGGALAIRVPRCRLVDLNVADNPASGLSYTNLSNFAESVDVDLVYNNNDNPATLVSRDCFSAGYCEDDRVSACIHVRRPRIGSVQVQQNDICSGSPHAVLLSYYSGREIADSAGNLTMWGRQAQTAIIRLAHAKMPHAPCDCSAADEMWKRDREVIVDGFGRPQRGISPFGPEEGAWSAYIFCNAPGMELVRGAVL